MDDDHEEEWSRIMGGRRRTDSIGPAAARMELRLIGCTAFLLAVVFLTAFALEWLARR